MFYSYFCTSILCFSRMQQIKQPILQEFEVFKQMFGDLFYSSNPLLNEVMSHIKNRSGKMMRPMLVLLMAKAFGRISNSTYHAAISLELLHTASLVHDDVVDESEKRRGQLSVNALFDNKISVLVGDYLLATSLKEAALTQDVRIVEAVALLGQYLSDGELVQLSNTSATHFSEDVYFEVIKKKTAALFAACSKVGVYSSGSNDEMAHIAYQFGELIGIAFQIKDDIFDYFSSDIGKPTGNDMREGKLTLPALYVLNNSSDESIKEMALKIRSLDATSTEIADFIEIIKQNGGIDYAKNVMVDYRNKALELLPASIDSEIRKSLTAYIDYVINRNK